MDKWDRFLMLIPVMVLVGVLVLGGILESRYRANLQESTIRVYNNQGQLIQEYREKVYDVIQNDHGIVIRLDSGEITIQGGIVIVEQP